MHQRCIEQVAAYRASGIKAKAWALANAIPLGTLGSWCADFDRWQAQLDGRADAGLGAEPLTVRPVGFVAARVASPGAASSVRIELSAGAARLELHWPLVVSDKLQALLVDADDRLRQAQWPGIQFDSTAGKAWPPRRSAGLRALSDNADPTSPPLDRPDAPTP
jgi:hypothetical protein